MNAQEFDKFLERKLGDIRETLISKGLEYVPENGATVSRFHNFEVGAALNDQTIEQVLWGFVTKHIVSVSDMVKDEPLEHALAKWDEKIGDITVYMLLLHAMVTQAHTDALTELKDASKVAKSTKGGLERLFDALQEPNVEVSFPQPSNSVMGDDEHIQAKSTTVDMRPDAKAEHDLWVAKTTRPE